MNRSSPRPPQVSNTHPPLRDPLGSLRSARPLKTLPHLDRIFTEQGIAVYKGSVPPIFPHPAFPAARAALRPSYAPRPGRRCRPPRTPPDARRRAALSLRPWPRIPADPPARFPTPASPLRDLRRSLRSAVAIENPAYPFLLAAKMPLRLHRPPAVNPAPTKAPQTRRAKGARRLGGALPSSLGSSVVSGGLTPAHTFF